MKITSELLENNFYRNLNWVHRYSNTKLIERESVGMHIADCQFIALKLVDIINKKYPNVKIDEYKLLGKIACHEFDEIFSGDLPIDFKYMDEEFHNLIDSKSLEFAVKKGLTQERVDKMKKSRWGKSIEAGLCDFIDSFQCIDKLYSEYKLQGTERIKNRYKSSLEFNIKKVQTMIDSDARIKPLKEFFELILEELKERRYGIN